MARRQECIEQHGARSRGQGTGPTTETEITAMLYMVTSLVYKRNMDADKTGMEDGRSV